MKRIGGQLLIAIGVIHTLVGLIVFFYPTVEIIGGGLVNGVALTSHPFELIATEGFYKAVEKISPRMAAFWFFWTGFSWMILGSLCYWIERKLKQPTPNFVAWTLLVYAMAGAVILPISGFWILIGASIYMIFAANSVHLYEDR